tara:strand:+ start:52 stop:240 length:189 start_codon:yes stop_codon:yes gene_type:complete
VPEFNDIAYFVFNFFENWFSNFFVVDPSKPKEMHLKISFLSSIPILQSLFFSSLFNLFIFLI